MRERIFRHEYGRGLNNYSDVYRLPADDEELERLDKQHQMFIEVMGGKYPPPMDEVLTEDGSGETKACLDLGCGSGCWIRDVALDYPHCSAVAVDLVPMQAAMMPPNLRSEVDDINLGLEHFYGQFDVVHARLVSSGIRDYAGLLDHTTRVLRPGGLLDLFEFDFRIYDEHRKPYVCNANVMQPPWAPLFMTMVNQAVRRRGGHVDAANLLERWVREHRCMTDVVYREYWIPTSPWARGDDEDAIRQRAFGEAFIKSARPLLLGSGFPEYLVDQVNARAERELDEARVPGYILCQTVYARKERV
ncbi:S-adenosyl-L-methionine-dependent methyltransferase [Gloeophyllum trabeum ATCC 11539]|uniref:S-adenosyl-L-methionine-dependent methyltransferase n=1 Tax=Gloeophyllum trabeum (strain ATCC 11539 / FP-39264 / Madison 617) TaxID=670483 RepID=S7RYT6_GLOTA|nr:S-adenosyl-L-methionine-dependent methyltransferase [Gloeophyllum trabeum ATCC 11539]EPQ60115.1 S-adenosyl-L-methionine-dependent methyltransferase [Gloeophyllum trabeum ATCC 11539]